MSYHINAPEYECKNCNQVFIAYSRGLPCPKCKTPEASQGKSYDFIDNVIRSIIINKNQHGNYIPPAWYIDGLSDMIQRNIFHSLEEIYSKRSNNISKTIKGFEEETTDENKPVVDHVINILSLVYERRNEFQDINNSLLGKIRLKFWPK